MICSRDKYREITGDSTSSDADVDTALLDAQQDLEEQTDRFFEQATRTEYLLLDREGFVSPRALPVISVSVPTQTTVDGNRVLIGSLLNISHTVDTRVWVTYVGGYLPAEMPIRLVRLVARMAYQDLHYSPGGASLPGGQVIPSGATSVRVGDVAFSGTNLGEAEAKRLRADIARWVHPSRRLEAY